MSLTFPRALPNLRILKSDLELDESGYTVIPETSGKLISVERAQPLWQARYATQAPNEALYGEWQAWLASLKGAGRMFYGQDVFRRYPLAHKAGFAGMTRAGGGSFSGAATSWSLNGDRDVLTLNGLPAAFMVTVGDYVMFRWDDWKRSLHRFLETGAANGSGAGAWTIEPGAPAWLDAEAVADLATPTCLMKVKPGTRSVTRDFKSRSVAFEALQYIEP